MGRNNIKISHMLKLRRFKPKGTKRSFAQDIIMAGTMLAESRLENEKLICPKPGHIQEFVSSLGFSGKDICSLFTAPCDFDIPEKITRIERGICSEFSRARDVDYRKIARASGFASAVISELVFSAGESVRSEGVLCGLGRLLKMSCAFDKMKNTSGYMSGFIDSVIGTGKTLSEISFAERVGKRVGFNLLDEAMDRMHTPHYKAVEQKIESIRNDIVNGCVSDKEAAVFLAELANYRDGKFFSGVFGKFPRRLCKPGFLFGAKLLPVGKHMLSPAEVSFARNYKLKTEISGKELYLGYAVLGAFRPYNLAKVPDEVLETAVSVERMEIVGRMCSEYGNSPSLNHSHHVRLFDSKVIRVVKNIPLAEYLFLRSENGQKEIVQNRKKLWMTTARKIVRGEKVSKSIRGKLSSAVVKEFLLEHGDRERTWNTGEHYGKMLQSFFSDEEAREIVAMEESPVKAFFNARKAFFENKTYTVVDMPAFWLGTRTYTQMNDVSDCRAEYDTIAWKWRYPDECYLKGFEHQMVVSDEIREKIQGMFAGNAIWDELVYRMEKCNKRGYGDILCQEFLKVCFSSCETYAGIIFSPDSPIPEYFLTRRFSAPGYYFGKTVLEYLLEEMYIPSSPNILFQDVPKGFYKGNCTGRKIIDLFLDRYKFFYRYSKPVNAAFFEAIVNVISDSRFLAMLIDGKSRQEAVKTGIKIGSFLVDICNFEPNKTERCIFRSKNTVLLKKYKWMRNDDMWYMLLARAFENISKTPVHEVSEKSRAMVSAMMKAFGIKGKNLSVLLERHSYVSSNHSRLLDAVYIISTCNGEEKIGNESSDSRNTRTEKLVIVDSPRNYIRDMEKWRKYDIAGPIFASLKRFVEWFQPVGTETQKA